MLHRIPSISSPQSLMNQCECYDCNMKFVQINYSPRQLRWWHTNNDIRRLRTNPKKYFNSTNGSHSSWSNESFAFRFMHSIESWNMIVFIKNYKTRRMLHALRCSAQFARFECVFIFSFDRLSHMHYLWIYLLNSLASYTLALMPPLLWAGLVADKLLIENIFF